MNDQSLSLLALDRAAASLTQAATELALAAALGRSVSLAYDASVLAGAVEAELEAVATIALRHA